MITLLLFAILSSFSFCDGAKILGIVPTASHSHQVVFYPIWKELSLRGHQVTVITTDPVNDPTLTNLTEIDLSFTYEYTKSLGLVEKIKSSYTGGLLEFHEAMVEITKAQVQHPKIQEIIKETSKRFDVALVEFIYPSWFGLAKKLKCPVIGIMSLDAPQFAYNLMGSIAHPVIHPDPLLPFSGKLNFLERFISTWYNVLSPYLWTYHMPDMEVAAIKLYEMDSLNLQEAYQNIELLFLNRNPVLQPVRPITPSIIEIGGGLHLKPLKPLPLELQTYLDIASEGVVYFSLGSNVKSKDLSNSMIAMLMETFSQLPFKVLWKYESDHLEGKPENVKTLKWLPQQDVLRHPNIKLFISQCGLQSIEEALYYKVPVICIPWIGDQKHNARIIASKGMGLILDYTEMTKDELNSTIFEVINNPKYSNSVKELAKFALDQPMTGLEKAVWWTEHIIRHQSGQHLKNPDFNIPIYQYYHLDVTLFTLILFLVLFILIRFIVKRCVRVLTFLFKRLKTKIE